MAVKQPPKGISLDRPEKDSLRILVSAVKEFISTLEDEFPRLLSKGEDIHIQSAAKNLERLNALLEFLPNSTRDVVIRNLESIEKALVLLMNDIAWEQKRGYNKSKYLFAEVQEIKEEKEKEKQMASKNKRAVTKQKKGN